MYCSYLGTEELNKIVYVSRDNNNNNLFNVHIILIIVVNSALDLLLPCTRYVFLICLFQITQAFGTLRPCTVRSVLGTRRPCSRVVWRSAVPYCFV